MTSPLRVSRRHGVVDVSDLRLRLSPTSTLQSTVQIMREGIRHQPDEAGWEALMQPVHDALADAEGTATAPLRHVEPDTARQEFVENGQTGLDELLAALDGDVEVRDGTSMICISM